MVFLQHVADGRKVLSGERNPVYLDRSVLRPDQTTEHGKKRGFATAAWTDDRDKIISVH